MKRTTLMLDERCFVELKRLAALKGRTLSDLINEFLQAGLQQHKRRKRPQKPFRLSSYAMGQPTINLADRDQLEQAMGGP